MLGKKRNSENIRQTASSKNILDTNHFSHSNKIKNCAEPKITKDLSSLYNMERSICLSCVRTKNKKYQSNKYIPCVPFSNSS